MTKPLEKLARGKECYLRLPGVCNGNPETTVLCHIRRGGLGGIGYKPVSISAMPMCSHCHDAYDGRANVEYTRTEMDAEALRGLVQWLDWLFREEWLILAA